jgi:hypothetical protein
MARVKTYRNENDVKAQVKKLLDQHGWLHWAVPMNGFGSSGISDRNALKDGVFLAIECKFGSNKPTALQYAYLQNVIHQGGYAFVVHEKNIDALGVWLASKNGELPERMAFGLLTA